MLKRIYAIDKVWNQTKYKLLDTWLTNKYDIDDSNFHRISCGVYGFNVSNIS